MESLAWRKAVEPLSNLRWALVACTRPAPCPPSVAHGGFGLKFGELVLPVCLWDRSSAFVFVRGCNPVS